MCQKNDAATLPGPEHSFVLAAVGTRGARELIAGALNARGYQAGVSCLSRYISHFFRRDPGGLVPSVNALTRTVTMSPEVNEE